MTSWSDRPEALEELQAAVEARDLEAAKALLGEKFGPDYADAVIAGVRLDVEAVAAGDP